MNMNKLVRNYETRQRIAADIDEALARSDSSQWRSVLSQYSADSLRRYMAAKVMFARKHKSDMISAIIVNKM